MWPGARSWRLALLVLPCLVAAGCGDPGREQPDAPAARVLRRAHEAPRVILAARAATRLGLTTARVRTLHGQRFIPYAATLYTPGGGAFAYTSPSRLVYVRRPVRVARIAGGRVFFTAGPAVGGLVVTTGAAELLGIEEGIQEG